MVTQEEAQFVIDWTNASKEYYPVGLSSNSIHLKIHKKAENLRFDLWNKTINEKTRWKAKMTRAGSNKVKLIYVPEDKDYELY